MAERHIQAFGTDSAGRRQYRYHDLWRIRRSSEKFERVQEFASALPRLRATVDRDLRRGGMSRERVLAAMVRLLDVGSFRIGGEQYAKDHDTFGVASLRQEHVRLNGPLMVFDYPAKGAAERIVEIEDAELSAVIARLVRRRSGGPNLFVYRQGQRWVEAHSADVNDYIKAAIGGRFSAKDFRTWSATVLTAAALGERPPDTGVRARRGAVADAVREASEHLGNTPTVCRSAYIDPRLIARFEAGETIAGRLPGRLKVAEMDRLRHNGRRYRAVEDAVSDLLDPDEHLRS